jgi:sialate O-acetylesterase
VSVPTALAGKSGKLILGCIVDADSAFINGQFVGTTAYQYPPRRYNIPKGLLRAGENTIVVKVVSNFGNGGFVKDKAYEIQVDDKAIDLRGEWNFRVGAAVKPQQISSDIKYRPVGLYNAMIAPLTKFAMKGVIWYQGETNAGRPHDYAQLMSSLIQDWRRTWQQEFPFVYIQLPNFGESKDQPSEGDWALLREAQLSLLSMPGTAMAVTIDLGEWNDIHPLKKKDVGIRAARAAEKIAYNGKNIIYSGPIYRDMKIKGDKVIISFSNVGNGLEARGGKLHHFSIAGADKKFVWAEAEISGDKVIVRSNEVKNPVAVRYAWADNPDGANLYNNAGLPASPFRTDDWPR